MSSAVTTFRPASIIVANWREKIWSDFGLTLFCPTLMPPPLVCASSSVAFLDPRARRPAAAPEHLGQEALNTQLLPGGSRRRSLHLAGQLEPVGVDRGVGVSGQDRLSTGVIGTCDPALETSRGPNDEESANRL